MTTTMNEWADTLTRLTHPTPRHPIHITTLQPDTDPWALPDYGILLAVDPNGTVQPTLSGHWASLPGHAFTLTDHHEWMPILTALNRGDPTPILPDHTKWHRNTDGMISLTLPDTMTPMDAGALAMFLTEWAGR